MTQIAIQQQVDAIIKATKEALRSKEAAQKFLHDAGINLAPKSTASTTRAKLSTK